MIALIQRVSSASVEVEGQAVGSIARGLLALIGIQRDDTEDAARRLIDKLLAFRVFADDAGRMNASLANTGGGLLLVSQFTLAADTKKGTKPSFSPAAPPAEAQTLFERFVALARERHPIVETGRFGADMKVSLVNDGPVTFWLEV